VSRLLQWRSLAGLALQLAILALLVTAFFMRASQVWGPSMSPSIAPGEYVLIDTFAYRFGTPRRGDVVAFHADDGVHDVFIKRVVGLPGDRIRIERGVVYVDGAALAEPYVRYPDQRSFPGVLVPADSVYVLGDNRADSDDSRSFGAVPDGRIVGRALAGIWPPSFVRAL